MIIKCFNNTDEIVTITRSEDDIVNYLNEFKERKRLDNRPILELKRCAGTQFDPYLVNIFINKVN